MQGGKKRGGYPKLAAAIVRHALSDDDWEFFNTQLGELCVDILLAGCANSPEAVNFIRSGAIKIENREIAI